MNPLVRAVFVTGGVLFFVLVIGGSPSRVVALTPPELATVAMASLAFAASAFFASLRRIKTVDDYLAMLIIVAVVALFAGNFVTVRLRGPACLDENTACKPPPPEVVDLDEWWRAWSSAGGVMMLSACLGVIGGALVKAEIQRAASRSG